MEKPKKLPLHAITRSAHSKIVQDLPPHVYEGIGKIVAAQAILETAVTDLLFNLAEIDFSVGRVVFRYQAGSERFKTVKRLMVLHGLETTLPSVPSVVSELEQQITDCCNARDQFAHGVWIQCPDRELALRVTKGQFETDEGIIDRTFVPQAMSVPDEYYEQTRQVILTTAAAIDRLRRKLVAALKARSALAHIIAKATTQRHHN